MDEVLNALFNWPWIKRHRTSVCEVLIVGLTALQAAMQQHLIPTWLNPTTVTALIGLLTAYGLKFAKEHEVPPPPTTKQPVIP